MNTFLLFEIISLSSVVIPRSLGLESLNCDVFLIVGGYTTFGLCVCVCMYATNFNVGNNFRTTGSRALIFHMCIPCGKIFTNIRG